MHAVIPKNENGRDFVIGDIHADKYAFIKALTSVNFDENKDRLFAIGDLIDRGNEPLFILEWFKKRCAFCIIGNHEQMILNRFEYPVSAGIYISGTKTREEAIGLHENNEGEWFSGLKYEQQETIYHSLKALPYVITLETKKDDIGLVHAEVPEYLESWKELIEGLEQGDKKLLEDVAWGRDAIAEFYDYHRHQKWSDELPVADRLIKDIGLTVHGHTGVIGPQVHGNQVWIDTGHTTKELTIIEVNELFDLVRKTNDA